MITEMLQTPATNDKHDSCNVVLQTELINLRAHQWRGGGGLMNGHLYRHRGDKGTAFHRDICS